MSIVPRNEIISFGPFRLTLSERSLARDGTRVELSGKAYDILVALLSKPNEVVSKKDLFIQVWPGIAVEEGSLRFHIANLRKALGDGKDGARYIATSSGQGYSFVGKITRLTDQNRQPAVRAGVFPHANLPVRLTMVNREQELERLPARLKATRFVTIVGAGGVGKTTLAIAVAHKMANDFRGAVLFVDLSVVSDPALVTTIVASMLGLSVQSEDAKPGLVAYLKDKRVLLLLDTCEHLIEAVAAFAPGILAAAPDIHILATSREALHADGENVYRLDALAYPPDHAGLTADVATKFPAVQLFVERARASGADLKLSDEEATAVAAMCRRLDGVALAIELAARRVKTYGVHQTAVLLDQRLALSWSGPREAPTRQKTLHATIDWSYSLLSPTERIVLRQVAVFVGSFTLDAVVAVSSEINQVDLLEAIDSLVAKSMIAARPSGAMMRYRLLDTTRAYALNAALAEVDENKLAARHAGYCRDWLKLWGGDWATLSSGAERAAHFSGMNNVRAALEWCFGPAGDTGVGIQLAAAAAEVFLAMSLLPECYRWSLRAIQALDQAVVGSADEMLLQAGLGLSSSQMYGESDAVDAALTRSLTIAERSGDKVHQAGLFNMQHMFHGRSGNFRASLEYAQRCRALAEGSDNLAIKAVAHAALGRALQFTGDLSRSRTELESLMRIMMESRRGTVFLGYDPHYRSGIALARTLWLQGYFDQAAERVREAVQASEAAGHSAALALVLAGAGSIFLWLGDLDPAEYYIHQSYSLAEANALGPLMAVGRCRKAELTIHQGKVEEGVHELQAALKPIHDSRHELLTTEFNIELALGLLMLGQAEAGLTIVDETISRVNVSGELFQMPELLRVKGKLLASVPRFAGDEAKHCFLQSLDLARSQGARAWELRTAMSIAELMAAQGKDPSDQLRNVLDQFSEGFGAVDYKAASAFLKTLH